MARRAEQASSGFSGKELKLSGEDELDVERVRAVQGVAELPLG